MVGDIPKTLPEFEATIPAMLRALTQRFAENAAVADSQTTLTYAELEERSANLACGLLALGVGKGDRVGILLPNGSDFTVAFMAATRIGAVAAPLSTLYQGAELQWVLENAAIRFLIIAGTYRSHDYLSRLEESLPGLISQSPGEIAVPAAPFLRSVLVAGECNRPWAKPLHQAAVDAVEARPEFDRDFLGAVEAQVHPSDPLCVIHTSGSTANPKGVVHGHGPFIRHSFQMANDFTPISPGDRVLALRPFFWVGGLAAQLFYCLQVGACHVSLADSADTTILREIEQGGATLIAGDEVWHQQLRSSPTLLSAGYEIIELTVEFSAVARRLADGRLEFISPNLAAQISPVEQADLNRLPWTFGMTEFLGAHTSLPFREFGPSDRPRVSGRPVPGVRSRICDPETHEILPPGIPGELEVRGYSMMLGMDGRERGDLWTDDGYYRTDDLAVMDADGYVTLIGRLGDGFKVKGANVAPLEVEQALYKFGEIERCCVLGIPRYGSMTDNLVVAILQIQPGQQFDKAAVVAQLKTQLSSYKVPSEFLIFAPADFPITGSGKIKRSDLKAKVIEQLANQAQLA